MLMFVSVNWNVFGGIGLVLDLSQFLRILYWNWNWSWSWSWRRRRKEKKGRGGLFVRVFLNCGSWCPCLLCLMVLLKVRFALLSWVCFFWSIWCLSITDFGLDWIGLDCLSTTRTRTRYTYLSISFGLQISLFLFLPFCVSGLLFLNFTGFWVIFNFGFFFWPIGDFAYHSVYLELIVAGFEEDRQRETERERERERVIGEIFWFSVLWWTHLGLVWWSWNSEGIFFFFLLQSSCFRIFLYDYCYWESWLGFFLIDQGG